MNIIASKESEKRLGENNTMKSALHRMEQSFGDSIFNKANSSDDESEINWVDVLVDRIQQKHQHSISGKTDATDSVLMEIPIDELREIVQERLAVRLIKKAK